MIVPLHIFNNDCPACNAKDSIVIIDSSRNIADANKKEVRGAICTKCNREYAIQWGKNDYTFIDAEIINQQLKNIFDGFSARDLAKYDSFEIYSF